MPASVRVLAAGLIGLSLLIGSAGGLLPVASLRNAVAQVAMGATLTILAAPVEVAPGDGAFAAAIDGQTIQQGDLIRTGTSGSALLTFFDGSETQLAADTQVRLDAPAQGAATGVSIFQAIGTTLNRVQPLTNGSSFETATPSSVALVRGTTYLVAVRHVVRPGADGGQQVAAAFPRTVEGVPYPLIGEVVYFDPPTAMLWRDRAWIDPESSVTWDTYEPMLDEAGQQVAASVPGAQAVEGGNDTITVAVLGTDPDGRVGQVDLQPTRPGLGVVQLRSAGDVGATSDQRSAKFTLSAQGLQAFNACTASLGTAGGALLCQAQGDEIAREAAPVVVPGGTTDGQRTGSTPPPPGGTQQLRQEPLAPTETPSSPATTATATPAASVKPVASAKPGGAIAAATSVSPPPTNTPAPGGGSGGGGGGGGSGGGDGAPPSTPTPTTAPTVPPPSGLPGVSLAIGPSGGGTVSFADNRVSVSLPVGALAPGSTVQLVEAAAQSLPLPPLGSVFAGSAFNVSATSPLGAPIAGVTNGSPSATVTFAYTGDPPTEIRAYDAASGTWQPLGGTISPSGPSAGTISAQTTQFTLLAPMRPLVAPATLPPTTAGSCTASASGSGTPALTSYQVRDNSAGAAGDPPYTWIEVSYSGSSVTNLQSVDDACAGPVALPFTFPFYGQRFDQVFIDNNGLLSFGNGTWEFANEALPTQSVFPVVGPFVAPLWDDIDSRGLSSGDGIYYQGFGSGANAYVVFEWLNWQHYPYDDTVPRNGERYTFEAILYADGAIVFQYQTMTDPANSLSATVGLQNQTGELAALYAFDDPGSTPAGRVVRFTPNGTLAPTVNPRLSTLSVAAPSGGLVADDTAAATVTVTLRDSAGNPVPGKDVALATNGTDVTVTPVSPTTNVSGQATFSVRSPLVQSITFSATDTTDNVTLTAPPSPPTLTFVPGPVAATSSSVVAALTPLPSDFTTLSTITVTLRDRFENPVSGKTVALALVSPLVGQVQVAATAPVTNSQGVATFSVRASAPQAATFQATDTTDALTIGTVSVTFATLPAGQATIVGQVKDGLGTPVGQRVVRAFDTRSGTQVGAATADGLGYFSFPNLPAGGAYDLLVGDASWGQLRATPVNTPSNLTYWQDLAVSPADATANLSTRGTANATASLALDVPGTAPRVYPLAQVSSATNGTYTLKAPAGAYADLTLSEGASTGYSARAYSLLVPRLSAGSNAFTLTLPTLAVSFGTEPCVSTLACRVRVAGSGWTPGTALTLSLLPGDGPLSLITIDTSGVIPDGAGAFDVTVPFVSPAPGSYTLQASQTDGSTFAASAQTTAGLNVSSPVVVPSIVPAAAARAATPASTVAAATTVVTPMVPTLAAATAATPAATSTPTTTTPAATSAATSTLAPTASPAGSPTPLTTTTPTPAPTPTLTLGPAAARGDPAASASPAPSAAPAATRTSTP